VLRFTNGKVSVDVSVAGGRSVPGIALRDAYLEEMRSLTLGLVQARGGSLYLGRLELIRFGPARVGSDAVEWPIEGGILARGAGGHLRLESTDGRLTSSVEGYRPLLPLPLYAVTQLPVHRLVTRLFLLRMRGREPARGMTADLDDRWRAAAVDLAFCATLAGLIGKRRKVPVMMGITAGYHLACWTLSGRTLGGLVMGQRVASIDGSRPSLEQSAVRLLAAPLAWFGDRTGHDQLASTDVVVD
jgi:hypothetical protein